MTLSAIRITTHTTPGIHAHAHDYRGFELPFPARAGDAAGTPASDRHKRHGVDPDVDCKLDRLGGLTALKLTFQRRDRSVVHREAFLATPWPDLRERVESIQLHGDQAVAACVMTDGDPVAHDLRLSVGKGQDWTLLDRANADTRVEASRFASVPAAACLQTETRRSHHRNLPLCGRGVVCRAAPHPGESSPCSVKKCC